MGLFDLLKKTELSEGIMEGLFECQRDGLTIRGSEYRPKQGKDFPIAIVCHGFMANQETVRHYTKILAEMGCAAYCFDFNGGSVMKSRSDGKTTDMSVLTEMQDLEAVIEYVRSLPYVDSEKIFLMGCSQGGFVSAMVAAKNSYPIEKLCLFYPALCIPDDARAGKMMASKFDPENIPETFYCGPMKLGRCYAEDAKGIDPYEKIKDYNGEVLIVHGTKDKIVNINYAYRAAETYQSTKPENMDAEKRIRLHIIEDGAHGFSKKHDALAIQELKEFVIGHRYLSGNNILEIR